MLPSRSRRPQLMLRRRGALPVTKLKQTRGVLRIEAEILGDGVRYSERDFLRSFSTKIAFEHIPHELTRMFHVSRLYIFISLVFVLAFGYRLHHFITLHKGDRFFDGRHGERVDLDAVGDAALVGAAEGAGLDPCVGEVFLVLSAEEEHPADRRHAPPLVRYDQPQALEVGGGACESARTTRKPLGSPELPS